MLSLNTTLETLNLESRTTASLDYMVSYADHTSVTFSANSTRGNIVAVGNTAILTAPAAATVRQVKYLSVRNRSLTVNTTVLVKKNTGATEYHYTSPLSLRPGECVIYSEQKGFEILNANGLPYLISVVDAPAPAFVFPEWCSAGSLTANKTLSTNTAWAVYVGRAPYALAGVNIRCNVITAAATITWAQVALATGPLVANGNSALTVVGTTDVSGVINTTGVKTIKVMSTNPVHEYDDLWIIIGNQATTEAVIRQGTVIDHHQQGMASSRINCKPSDILGVATGFLTESNTASNSVSLICIGYT